MREVGSEIDDANYGAVASLSVSVSWKLNFSCFDFI